MSGTTRNAFSSSALQEITREKSSKNYAPLNDMIGEVRLRAVNCFQLIVSFTSLRIRERGGTR